MGIVLCSQHKLVGDTSMFCFVNANGSHCSPRACRCLMVPAGNAAGDWLPYSPTTDAKRYHASAAMPSKEFTEAMKKKFGKVNPDCPITDPHEPIDPRGQKLPPAKDKVRA